MIITVKYLPATNYRGSRYVVQDQFGNKRTYPYDYSSNRANETAFKNFCKDFSIKGDFVYGCIKDVYYYINKDNYDNVSIK